MLRARLLSPRDLGVRDLEYWRSLQGADSAFRSPLMGPEFAALVGKVRDDAAVLVFTRNGRPVGFLPHHRRPSGMGRPIGAPFSDLHALVSEDGLGLDDEALLRHAGLSSFHYSGLIDPHGVFARSTNARQLSWRVSGERAFETIRDAHRIHFKKALRHERKLAALDQDVAVNLRDTNPATLDKVFGWKRSQLNRTGLHDFFRPQWTRSLMRLIFESPFGSLVTLNVGGNPIAGRFAITVGGACHVWIRAYDPAFARYSPGNTLLWRFLEAMPALGIDICDVGPGGEHDKATYSTETISVCVGVAPSRRPPLFPASRSVHRRLEHIAEVELDGWGRAYGLLFALASQGRRSGREATVADVEPAHPKDLVS